MNIPASAAPDVQQAFRDVHAALDRLRAVGAVNIDLHGTRLMNAGDGVANADYVTLRQLLALATTSDPHAAGDETFQNILVRGIARFLTSVVFRDDLDACVLFTEHGELTGDQDNLSWRYTTNTLRFGAETRVKWHHGIEFKNVESGGTTFFEFTGEDQGVTSVGILVFGTGAGAPALKPNGTTLEARLGNDSAYTDVKAKTFQPSTRETYTPSNVTPLRTGDFSALNAADVRSVLGTLITDLQAAGLLA